MGVIVYTSSASASAAVKNKQKAIIDYLKSRKIEFEEIDLCVHTDAKDIMRSKIPEEIKKKNEEEKKVVIPPQVFNDDEYCGDYDMFFAAREMELLHTFFKVPPSPEEKKKLKSIDWSSVDIEDKENDGNAENLPTGELENIAEQAAESDDKGIENGTDGAKEEVVTPEKEGDPKDRDETEMESKDAEDKMENAEKVDKADPGGDANVSNEGKEVEKGAEGESAEAGSPQDAETDKEPEAAATE